MVNVTTCIYKRYDGTLGSSVFWIDNLEELSQASKEFGRLQRFPYGAVGDFAWGYIVGGKKILVTDFTI